MTEEQKELMLKNSMDPTCVGAYSSREEAEKNLTLYGVCEFLSRAFIWRHTPEGYNLWGYVYEEAKNEGL